MNKKQQGTGFESLDSLTATFRAGDRSRRRSLVGGVAALLAAASILIFTPAGPALAGLVGIGSEPSEPAPLEPDNAVVIGTGEEFDTAYEVVATEGASGTCASLAFSGRQSTAASSCFGALSDSNPTDSVALPLLVDLPDELDVENLVLLQGVAKEGVTSTTVRVGGDVLQAQTFQLDDALAASIGSAQRGAFFFAAVPRAAILDEGSKAIEVELGDASNQIVGRTSQVANLLNDARPGLDDQLTP